MATTIQQIELPKKARAVDTSSGWQTVNNNLTTNGDFATGDFTGWSNTTQNSGAKSIVGGAARLDATAASDSLIQIFQDMGLVSGKRYRITFTITNHNGDTSTSSLINNSGSTLYAITGNGVNLTFDFTHSISDPRLFFRASDGSKYDIDNISVLELQNFPNNNHGQIYSGRGLEFDGIGDYLSVGSGDVTFVDFSAETTQEARAWTIACWINIDSAGLGYMQNVTGTATGISTSYLGVDTAEKLTIYDQTGTTYRVSDTALNVNTWYRAVWVFNGIDEVAFYLNGIADGVGAMGTSGDDADLAFRYIGARVADSSIASSSRYFAGKMADFQAWQGAFTAEDASYDYLNPESLALNNSGTALTESNLKLWYPMQDGHRGQQSYILDGANTGAGDELVSESDFSGADDGDPWITGTGWTIGSGVASCDGTAGAVLSQAILDIGKTYKVTFDVNFTSGRLAFASSDYEGPQREFNATESYSIYVVPKTTSIKFYSISFIGSVDNVSVKAINDKNHATTVFYGDELWDGTQGDDANWSLFGNNTKAEDAGAVKITYVDNASGGYIMLRDANDLNADLVVGKTYIISFSTKVNQGSIVWRCLTSGGGTNALATAITSTSFETRTMTVVADHATDLYIHSHGMTTGDIVWIKDISVKEVGVASGWTDADQQLHIPQTALQSYNELAWFDGTSTSNGYVALDSQIATTNNNWSLSFWMFRLDTGAAYSFIFGQNDNEKIIAVDNNGNEKLSYRETGGAYHALSNAVLPYGEWIHVVITATADTSMTAYIDGDAQTTNSDMSDTELVLDWIMRGYQNANYNILGSVNEISYYNDVLTAAEALDLFNDGKAKSALEASGSAGLVGYWRNNGLSEWKDLKGSNDGNTTASVVETILIPQGVDSTRDAQGFIMNKQKDTSCLNLTNGSDKPYIDLGSVTTVADDEAFSFSAWLKPDDITNNYIFGLDSSNNLRIANATTISIAADGVAKHFAPPTAIVPGEWVHLAIVRKASNDLVTIYKNGVISTDTETLNEPFDYRYLGALDNTNNFRGQTDGILIYESELSAAEVLRNYNATKGNHRN